MIEELRNTHIINALQKLAEGRDIFSYCSEGICSTLVDLELDTYALWGKNSDKSNKIIYHSIQEKIRLLHLNSAISAKHDQLQIPPLETLWQVHLPIAMWIIEQQERLGKNPLVLGLSGAQGSGKSTLSRFLEVILTTYFHQKVATLSLDDFYLSHGKRQQLAKKVHPLFVTRGVPGTHDTILAIKTLESLKSANQDSITQFPKFDKGLDNRLPDAEGIIFQGRPDIIIFEGWCVGTHPESDQQLIVPINQLEIEEDKDSAWRHYINQVLHHDYAKLFSLLDRLIFIKIPSFQTVCKQRLEQEQSLAHSNQQRYLNKRTSEIKIMDKVAIKRFIAHFQRITEYMLREVPSYADMVLEINDRRVFLKIQAKN
ncbi:kinase [Candidatus Nitrosacidococcus sp. I8]|uniref:kinase n=1 Tax=Candidatus Nitrosacidococcus sp. I8 TaxID=2942908 RepID=UPI002225FE84|nr:kinase [Candidatus Nitrosacidococcus sp. I8]CAH9017825.1 Pantothenate kinase [Candidatus Nitrosacidococcus sp. I8]